MSMFRGFLCNVLGWHSPSAVITFDGVSFHSVCRHCGRRITQDSQGNWY